MTPEEVLDKPRDRAGLVMMKHVPGAGHRRKLELANEGAHAAEETVFLFVRKPVSRVARPLLELKGFMRMGLEPGERARGVLTLPVSALAFPGPDLTSSVEPGDYEILVGPSADRTRLLRQVVHIEEGGA